MRLLLLLTLVCVAGGCSRAAPPPPPPAAPRSWAEKLNEAQVLLGMGQDASAQAAADEILANHLPLTDEERARLCRIQAILEYHRGNLDRAAELAGEAIRLDPETIGYRLSRAFYRATAAGEDRRSPEERRRLREGAAADLKAFLKERPRSSSAWELLAVVSDALGDARQAKEARDKADEIDPKHERRQIVVDAP